MKSFQEYLNLKENNNHVEQAKKFIEEIKELQNKTEDLENKIPTALESEENIKIQQYRNWLNKRNGYGKMRDFMNSPEYKDGYEERTAEYTQILNQQESIRNEIKSKIEEAKIELFRKLNFDEMNQIGLKRVDDTEIQTGRYKSDDSPFSYGGTTKLIHADFFLAGYHIAGFKNVQINKTYDDQSRDLPPHKQNM